MSAKKILVLKIILLLTSRVLAELRLPTIISDNMVLQQESDVAIWGWAEAGSRVSVNPSWLEYPSFATTDQSGRWGVTIKTPKASTSEQSIVITGGQEALTLRNVLIGEVWFCSGQSNMGFRLARSEGGKQAIASADIPTIRLFRVERNAATEPADDCVGSWMVSSSDNVRNFSAVAFYFGRELHKKLDIPIGLIESSWGGSPAESWTPREAIKANHRLLPVLDREATQPRDVPSSLYRGMVYPIQPFGIRGVIWYQGESNRNYAEQYKTLFPTLIQSWRDTWGIGDFPFYFVQLAPHPARNVSVVPELQEAQLHTMKNVSNTGMVVTTDIGDIDDVHPANKEDVGKRLSFWALARNYGQNVAYCGPLYKDMAVEGDRIRLFFSHDEGGFVSKDGPLREFTIAGPDMEFHPAQAVIEGRSIVVSSDKVPRPVAVRYCWRNIAEGNLYNQAGLPASPFRTGK